MGHDHGRHLTCDLGTQRPNFLTTLSSNQITTITISLLLRIFFGLRHLWAGLSIVCDLHNRCLLEVSRAELKQDFVLLRGSRRKIFLPLKQTNNREIKPSTEILGMPCVTSLHWQNFVPFPLSWTRTYRTSVYSPIVTLSNRWFLFFREITTNMLDLSHPAA